MTTLPPWVYDLVSAVDDYEDEHASHADCLYGVWSKVPSDVLERARAIAGYVRETERQRLLEASPEDGEKPTDAEFDAFRAAIAECRGDVADRCSSRVHPDFVGEQNIRCQQPDGHNWHHNGERSWLG